MSSHLKEELPIWFPRQLQTMFFRIWKRKCSTIKFQHFLSQHFNLLTTDFWPTNLKNSYREKNCDPFDQNLVPEATKTWASIWAEFVKHRVFDFWSLVIICAVSFDLYIEKNCWSVCVGCTATTLGQPGVSPRDASHQTGHFVLPALLGRPRFFAAKWPTLFRGAWCWNGTAGAR